MAVQLKVREDQYDVGVIIGRFQIHELHKAHKALIEAVRSRHDKVIIFLGLSPLKVTDRNPLDFEARKQMILEQYPEINVLYIKDVNNDEIWSKRLDEMISDLISPAQTVVLYGGRDSFINHYSGRYPTVEFEQDVWISASEERKGISRKSVKASPDFRAGVVWAASNRFPVCYPTVDIAIFNEDQTKILLARKPYETGWRFVGGFADPADDSYENSAIREVAEETGLEITPPIYIGSCKIDDWRYRSEADKIKTLLFAARQVFGRPTPMDDIAELRWFDIIEKGVSNLKLVDVPSSLGGVVEAHKPLIDLVNKYLNS